MADDSVTKGSTVEVSSDEPGFHGAWYVATVVDQVDASPTKTKSSNSKNRSVKKTGYLVKYETLLKEDDPNEPLTEVVHPSFVRPLPPRNIRRNNDDIAKEAEVEEGGGGGDFELYDVVDAYHRDGWWVGVVKTVILDGEMNKYVVSFENPPEEFEFQKSNIRFHVDWVDHRWLVPPKKKPGQESGDRNASDVACPGFTTPSKGTLIAHGDNVAAVALLSAKTNSRSTRSGTNSAVDTAVTYSRNKRNVNLVEDDLRRKKFQSSAGGKRNAKAIVHVLETRGSDDIHQDSPPVEHAVIITQTRDAENGQSHQKRKRGRKPKSVVKKQTSLLQDGHGLGADMEEQPLSFWYQGMHPFSVLKRSSCFSPPDNSLNQTIVTGGGGGGTTTTTTDYQQDWPFIKRAPIWVTIESLELYQTPPQKPHFSPLKTMKKDYREGLAIGLMVTFGNIVQGISDLQLNDPVDIINTSLETLCELEAHGFNVGQVRGRLNELLSLKSKVGPHEDRRKEVETELDKCNREKSLVEKEMDQLKTQMQVLTEKTLQSIAMQKAKEEESMRLQTSLDLVSKQINDWEVTFEKLCKKSLI